VRVIGFRDVRDVRIVSDLPSGTAAAAALYSHGVDRRHWSRTKFRAEPHSALVVINVVGARGVLIALQPRFMRRPLLLADLHPPLRVAAAHLDHLRRYLGTQAQHIPLVIRVVVGRGRTSGAHVVAIQGRLYHGACAYEWLHFRTEKNLSPIRVSRLKRDRNDLKGWHKCVRRV
jgi:hypothetical protein